MKTTLTLLAAALMAAVTTVAAAEATPVVATSASTNAPAKAKLPRLVDLGADKCIPCKKMAPILEELKKDYAGRLDVEFIDVWKKPDAAKPYKVRLIPTQIFFGADDKELFRHEGFFSREDILAKWKELGVNLDKPAVSPLPTTNSPATN